MSVATDSPLHLSGRSLNGVAHFVRSSADYSDMPGKGQGATGWREVRKSRRPRRLKPPLHAAIPRRRDGVGGSPGTDHVNLAVERMAEGVVGFGDEGDEQQIAESADGAAGRGGDADGVLAAHGALVRRTA